MKLLVRLAAVALAAASLLVAPTSQALAAEPASGQRINTCSVVWFDLGNTLIDTTDRTHLTYMPSALRYLRQLHFLGVPLGIVTNVPPSWGATDAERAEATKKFISASWALNEPFVWDYFGDRILTPRSAAESKPAPALFQRAIEQSGNCVPIFEAETADEIAAAQAAGMRGYLTGQPSRSAFLPLWQVLLPDLIPCSTSPACS